MEIDENILFETAHRAAHNYKSISDSGMSETDKGHELFGQSTILQVLICELGICEEYVEWLDEKCKKRRLIRANLKKRGKYR